MSSQPKELMWKRLIKLSSDRKMTYQRQLIESIVAAILDSKIPPKQALPSSRELAKQLSIARNTVVHAYQQLIDDGYIVARERSGYFVNHEILQGRAELKTPKNKTEPKVKKSDFYHKLKMHPSEQRNIVKAKDWKDYKYPFIYGQLDSDMFPLHGWRDCCRQALSVSSIQYSTPDLYDSDDALLIEQIQAKILSRRGVWATPDEILITMGAQQALYIIAELLVDHSTQVGIENPGYVDARNIFDLKTKKLKALEIDQNGLIPGQEVNSCDMVYMTPSHQFPTTVTMNLERREQLLKDATEQDFLIIEDDYESEINYFDSPSPALKSLDTDDRVLYVGSLSKTLAPGLRLGYMVASPDIIKEARAIRRLMIRHPPLNNQHLVALFLSMGHHDSLLQRLRETYKKRWQTMGDSLANYMPDAARIPTFGGTAYWVKGPDTLNSNELKIVAQDEGILLEPGDIFFKDPDQHKNFFRLGYSSIPEDRIDEGIKKLSHLIQNIL